MYKEKRDLDGVLIGYVRLSDNADIPLDPGNRHYQEVKEFIEVDGGVVEQDDTLVKRKDDDLNRKTFKQAKDTEISLLGTRAEMLDELERSNSIIELKAFVLKLADIIYSQSKGTEL